MNSLIPFINLLKLLDVFTHLPNLFHEYQITVISNKSPSIHHWDFTKAYLWMSRRAQTGIRSLLLAPTRELATQIHEEATKFAKASGYASACVPCSYKIGMFLLGYGWMVGLSLVNYIYANLVTSWFFKQAFSGRLVQSEREWLAFAKATEMKPGEHFFFYSFSSVTPFWYTNMIHHGGRIFNNLEMHLSLNTCFSLRTSSPGIRVHSRDITLHPLYMYVVSIWTNLKVSH